MSCRIRIATTESDLAKGWLLYAHKLPRPDLPIYSDHSTKVAVTDGGQALRGFPSASMTWDRLTWEQARTLRKLIEDSLDSADGLIYATIDRSWNRAGSLEDWIDIKGRAHIPDMPPVSGTDGRLNDNVTLFIGNVEIINDPASF